MKINKTAVLSVVVCFALCCSMLLGGTVAWFKDEASSTNNIIKSGTLDAQLFYSDDNSSDISSWTEVKDSSPAIYSYELWEPGYTDVKYFNIMNNGSLSFKYTLTLSAAPDTDGDNINLADVIDVYMGNMDEGVTISNRNQLSNLNYVGTLSQLMADGDGAAYGKLLAGEETGSLCIALKMQESAGNEYQNQSIGNGIAITLVAEQYTYEDDSMGDDYDENAGLPVARVTNLDVPEQTMYIIPDITQGFGGGSNVSVKPDAAFTFTAQDDATTIDANPYKDWLVDYYVSINEPVEDGIILIGAYGNWQSGVWYGFNVPADDYTTATPLLGTMTGGVSNWTYADIVTGVSTFNCGVANTNDANDGKVMTVELRIINPADTTEYYVISSTNHTFG